MFKTISSILAVIILGYVGVSVYSSYKGGYFNMPSLPDGAYPISFKNGLRAIVLDAEVEDDMMRNSPFFRRLALANPSRKYLGVPLDVPSWFEDAWVFCDKPTEAELAEIATFPEDFQESVRSARLEAVCMLDVDGQDLPRGLIYSVPKL